MKNICIFGDSVAKGVVFDEIQNRYVFLKESFANLFEAQGNIPVKNYAKFGCTVEKGALLVEKHIDELCDYDYTVLEFGGNDCDMKWSEIATAPEKEHMPNTTDTQFEVRYNEIVSNIIKKGGKPVIFTLPPLDATRFFNWVSKGLCESSILKFLGGDVEYIYRWHELYNNALYRIALKQNVPLIDIRQAFLKEKNYRSLICPDGMHPNAKGHNVILDAIKAALPSFPLCC